MTVNASGVATLTHDGSSNFAVWSHQGFDLFNRDLEVNEIGPYVGDQAIDPGTIFLVVMADGNWSVDF